MSKRFIFAAALALANLPPQTSVAQSVADPSVPSLSTVVAVVNGTEITLGHIAVAKASLPDQYRNLPSNVLFPGILEQLVQQTLLMQDFLGNRPPRVTLALENEERSLVAAEVVERIMSDAIPPGLVEDMYKSTYASQGDGLEYNAAHILVDSEAAALSIKEQLDGGADFATLAKELSTGPSGPRGGGLGWFGPGAMVAEFENTVVGLAPGEVSWPVQTQFGWHVIKLLETRPKEAPPLEDVREELELEIRRESVTKRIEELTADAIIDRSAANTLNPAVLDDIDLTGSK